MREPALDALISPPVPLTEAPGASPRCLVPEGGGLMPLISYDTPQTSPDDPVSPTFLEYPNAQC
ncbi:MAG: hypothetical protein HPM95_04825 [Alphaproteobacteria bacterium]|nr:hypothetical protein [Alphaproteobacteria bacterium]